MTALRPELTPLPERMKDLPLDDRGYPVPWFVQWIDGAPEFRVMDREKWKRAVQERLCWVCGQKLGSYLCFVLGPMCGVTRHTVEPPLHLECARWSAINCPFLARPHMERREHEKLMEAGVKTMGGCPIYRNPGVALLWITHSYVIERVENGYMIMVGPAIEVEWWADAKPASRRQVEESVLSGMPFLEKDALEEGPDAVKGLYRELHRMEQWYPK
jgi:hypothetical protein